MKEFIEYVIKRLEYRIEFHKAKGKGTDYSDGAIDAYGTAKKFLQDELDKYNDTNE